MASVSIMHYNIYLQVPLFLILCLLRPSRLVSIKRKSVCQMVGNVRQLESRLGELPLGSRRCGCLFLDARPPHLLLYKPNMGPSRSGCAGSCSFLPRRGFSSEPSNDIQHHGIPAQCPPTNT